MRVGTPKFQTAHGFRRGQPVCRSGNRFALATTATGFVGVVGTILSLDQFELITSGELDGVPNLAAAGDNAIWYLTTTPGLLSTAGTVPVGKVVGRRFLVQTTSTSTTSGGSGGGGTTTIIQGPALSDMVPTYVELGPDSGPGTSDEAARANHRHKLVLPSDNWTGALVVMTHYDPKTGMMKHAQLNVANGFVKAPTIGAWHPYHETLDATSGIVTPCAGIVPGGSHTYRHISNALSYIADDDNVSLEPRFLAPLVCDSDIDYGVASASVSVSANAGSTWFGSVLPIQFINNDTSPRRFAVQVHTPSTLPAGHGVSMGIGNIPECECQWMAEMPTGFDSIESIYPDGGEMTIWLFLGLGIPDASPLATPIAAPYTIQVDAWIL